MKNPYKIHTFNVLWGKILSITMSSIFFHRNVMVKIGLYSVLFLVIFAGGFLRFRALSLQPYWMDESFTINAVMSIGEHGSTILDSGRSYSCPIYCYPTAFFAKIFGADAFSYRFVAAAAGTIFIAVIFLIASVFFDRFTAILTTIFVVFSYFQIAWSRQARWYTLFELFFWLALFFFYLLVRKESNKVVYGALTLLFTILAIATHALGVLLPIIFLAWLLFDRTELKKRFVRTALMIAGIIVAAIAALWIFSNTGTALALVQNIKPSYELPYWLNFYLRNYWLFIPFALIALWDTKNLRRKEIRWLGSALLIYLIPLSFLTNVVEYRYLFMLTPVFFMLGALGMQFVAEYFPKTYQKVIFYSIIFLLFFTIGGGVAWPQNMYFLESDNPGSLGARPHYAFTPQPDWNGAYAFISSHETPSDIVISSLPTFNKIFLGQAGYWIEYNYLGFTDTASMVHSGREYYVGAQAIGSVSDLKSLMQSHHGFIIYDYMAAGLISPDILAYISTNARQVFYENTNSYSQVWVYQF